MEHIHQQTITIYDLKAYVNKSDIKQVILNIEKTINKTQSDFVVLLNCSRFVLTDLNNREWPKYYHLSYVGTAIEHNVPMYSRRHLLLSRYPILRAEYFGNPLVVVAETIVPFNDLPIDVEYDRNNAKIVFVISTESGTEEHSQNLTHIIETIVGKNHTVFCIECPNVECDNVECVSIKPDNIKPENIKPENIKPDNIRDNDELKNNETPLNEFPNNELKNNENLKNELKNNENLKNNLKNENLRYYSQLWTFESFVERTRTYHFKIK